MTKTTKKKIVWGGRKTKIVVHPQRPKINSFKISGFIVQTDMECGKFTDPSITASVVMAIDGTNGEVKECKNFPLPYVPELGSILEITVKIKPKS